MTATIGFLLFGALAVGGLLAGALGTAMGIRTTLWTSAVGLLLAALWQASALRRA